MSENVSLGSCMSFPKLEDIISNLPTFCNDVYAQFDLQLENIWTFFQLFHMQRDLPENT